jgi:hypothetical protein
MARDAASADEAGRMPYAAPSMNVETTTCGRLSRMSAVHDRSLTKPFSR